MKLFKKLIKAPHMNSLLNAREPKRNKKADEEILEFLPYLTDTVSDNRILYCPSLEFCWGKNCI